MRFEGPLQRMSTVYHQPVKYALELGDDLLFLNGLIGRKMRMEFLGKHTCFCGEEVDEVFQQNFCKPCFFSKPQASPTIFQPELSRAHEGIEERDLAWEQAFQLQPHLVYLAKTNKIKVGVTRHNQMPTRWMDQGADEAAVLLEVPNRYLAGQAEVFFKDYFDDKTSWRAMLKGETTSESLEDHWNRAAELLPAEFKDYLVPQFQPWQLRYPLETPPTAVKSLGFRSQTEWEGTLLGIKGQYLLLDCGAFNVRSHSGYQVRLELL